MPVTDANIGSEQAFLQNVRALMSFLNDAGDLMRGAALARAVQWGRLQTPPHEGGRTRLPAPRAAGVAEIKELLANGNYAAAWQLCEGMLFEPGCHVLLDLQWFAYQAAKGLQRADVAALIAAETGALLRRIPDLVRCRFEDDTPFAQPETQRWLTDLAESKANAGASQDEQETRIDQRVAEAQDVAQEKSLADGLAILADTLTLDTRGQFRIRLEMAVLCLDHQRADLALPVLDELTLEAQQTCLATWDKSLAMSLARHHQDALRLLMSHAGEHEKGVFAERINKLAADMCKADLVQAAQVL
jgi:type VI secretion system protein VasJ